MSATDSIIRKIRAMGYSVTVFKLEAGAEIHAVRLRDSYRLVVRDLGDADQANAANALLRLVTDHPGVGGISVAERRTVLSANRSGRHVTRASNLDGAVRQ